MRHGYSTAGLLALALWVGGPAFANEPAAEPAATTAPQAAPPETTAEGFVPPKIGAFAFSAKKIRKLLEQGDAYGAEALLVQKEDKLAAKPYYRFLLVKTGKAVRDTIRPQMQDAQEALVAVNERRKFTDNRIADLGAALNKASAALTAYKSHPLLQRPEFAMSVADEINSQLATAGGHLQKNAKAFFLAHDHVESNFFDVYPLQLGDDERRALVAASDRWIAVAMKAEQPGRVLAQYFPWADDKLQQQARRALAARIVKRNNWPATLTVAHQFHLAIEIGQELGMPAVDVAVVTVGNGGPAMAGVDNQPMVAAAHELEPVLQDLQQNGVRYVLVRDLGRVLTWEQVGAAGKPATSQRVVGTRRVANPAYAQAQAAVQQAQNELAAAQQRAATAAANAQVANAMFSQFGGGDNSQGWMALAGKAAAGMNAGSANSGVTMAQSRLNQAQLTLANTPTQIDEPVEQPYPVPTRLIERNKVQELAVYYADLQARNVQPVTQRDTQRKDIAALVRFDPNDRHQQELKNRNEQQLNELRMALPDLLALESVLAKLDNPLALAARAGARGGASASGLAALVVADGAAWEKWKERQLAGKSPMLSLDPLYAQLQAPEPAPAAAVTPAANDPDSILWAETRASHTIEAYEWYIERFPKGLRVGLARAEIRRLKAAGH